VPLAFCRECGQEYYCVRAVQEAASGATLFEARELLDRSDDDDTRAGFLYLSTKEPWPEAIVGANRDAKGRAMGTEGGYTIINARRIWDADPNHQTISYSTDQNYADLVVLDHELKSFSIVFSMADIHKIIGPNAARFVGMADQIGTLEAGKMADIVILDGNPLGDLYDLLNVEVVIKGGVIVADKR